MSELSIDFKVHCFIKHRKAEGTFCFWSRTLWYWSKDPSSADFTNNCRWYICAEIDNIMTPWSPGIIVSWCQCKVSWCHMIMVVEESTAGAIRFGMPRLLLMVSDLMVRTSLVTYSPSWSSSSSWYHYRGIIIEPWYQNKWSDPRW